MMGVFVQTNTESRFAKSRPVGYVIQESGCWEWVGAHHRLGYGSMYVRGKGWRWAHRELYERQFGPLADSVECHHVCANPSCVRPDHMLPVTRLEHYRVDRKWQAGLAKSRERNAAKTHCKHGHSLADALATSSGRLCRECHRRRQRARWARLRDGAPGWKKIPPEVRRENARKAAEARWHRN